MNYGIWLRVDEGIQQAKEETKTKGRDSIHGKKEVHGSMTHLQTQGRENLKQKNI